MKSNEVLIWLLVGIFIAIMAFWTTILTKLSSVSAKQDAIGEIVLHIDSHWIHYNKTGSIDYDYLIDVENLYNQKELVESMKRKPVNAK